MGSSSRGKPPLRMISIMWFKALSSVGERGLLLVVWATGSGALVEARLEMTVARGVRSASGMTRSAQALTRSSISRWVRY